MKITRIIPHNKWRLTFPFAWIHANVGVDEFVKPNQQLVGLDDKTINTRSANCLERIGQTSHNTSTTTTQPRSTVIGL